MVTISQIAESVNGRVDGNSDLAIQGVCDLKNSCADHISYIISEKYEKYFHQTKAEAFLVNNDFTIDRGSKTLIRVENPAISFIDVINLFYPKTAPHEKIHKSAVISENAKIGKNVQIAPHVVIENNVHIGDCVQIGAGTFIGADTTIEKETVIQQNVSIFHNVKIGNNCIIDAGAVIGADGFGLVSDKNIHHKIPHIGGVILEDNVWVGPNCCIDRGTLSSRTELPAMPTWPAIIQFLPIFTLWAI